MRNIIIAVIGCLVISGCKKSPDTQTIPPCIQSKITTFKSGTCPANAHVKEYIFQNKVVFSFYIGKCGADIPSEILDSDCNYLGSLGGISGNTKINGIEFSTATYVATLWSN